MGNEKRAGNSAETIERPKKTDLLGRRIVDLNRHLREKCGRESDAGELEDVRLKQVGNTVVTAIRRCI